MKTAFPKSTPEYTRSFATKIREAEEKLGLVHDQHFSFLQLNEAAAIDLLKRMDDGHPHSPFFSNFDLDTEHPTRPDHYLRADTHAVIALRSRLGLDSTLFNSSLHNRKMKASPKCEHCGQPETIKHVILSCSQYDSLRAPTSSLRSDSGIQTIISWRSASVALHIESSKDENLLPTNALRPRSS